MFTTTDSPGTDLAAFAAGFVAAEGCFTRTGNIFTMSVSLGADDAGTIEALHAFLRVGAVHRSPRRRAHYQDEIALSVRSLPDLVGVVVPFMDEHLPPSYKRTQYEAWRTELLDYWEHRAKRVRACTVTGCDAPRRAKGLCRHHYYEAYGR